MKKNILLFVFLFMNVSLYLLGVDAGADEKEQVNKYLHDLEGSGNEKIALEWLAILRAHRAIPYLTRILEEEESGLEEFAILCLGRIGHSDGIIPLVKLLLADKESYYYHDCFDSLKRIDPQWMMRDEVRAFIPQFFKEFEIAREAGSDEDDSYASLRRRAALLKFILLTGPKQAVPLCLNLMENPGNLDSYTQSLLLKNLVNQNVTAAWEPILKNIFYPKSDIALLPELIEALDKLHPGWENTETFEANLNAQLKRIEREYPGDVRCQAIDIVKMVKPSALIPLLEKIVLAPEETDEMKTKAISNLGEMSPEEHFDLFVPGLMSPDRCVRFASIESLGMTRDVRAVPHLIELLGNPDEDTRISAVSALSSFKSREFLRPLVELAQDSKNFNMVIPICFALSSIEPDTPVDEIIEIWEKWRKKLSDKWANPMEACLFEGNDPRMMDYLIRIYPAASVEEKLQLLGYFIRKKDKRSLPVFREALKSSDIRMRAYAETGIFNLNSD
jgi:HEAT repeat protein